MYLHQKLPVEEVEKTPDENDSRVKLIKIEVNGKKVTVSKMEELDNDILDAMAVDDFLKLYETKYDDKTQETSQIVDEEIIHTIQDEITTDDIMKMNENDSVDTIDRSTCM